MNVLSAFGMSDLPGGRAITGQAAGSPWRSRLLRMLAGAVLGCIPFAVALAVPALHRSMYVIAYPAVILSAWLCGPLGSISTAVISGLFVEHFISSAHTFNLAPRSSEWGLRQLTFLFGSVLAGTLTRRAAQQRERQGRLVVERELALARAEHEIMRERERNRDLAREDEVRTELALEGADLGTWEWNLETNLSRWSPGFYRLHRLTTDTEASFAMWQARVHPDDYATVQAQIDKAIDTEDGFTAEYRLRNGEGDEERWIEIGGKVIETADGNRPRLMVGYGLDITRRKRTEAALIRTEKLAVAGRLAASIAHEINNPLEAAVNLVYLSRMDMQDPERASYLDEAMVQLDRVASIAHQTLSFSRRSAGPSVCQPAEVLDSVLRLLRPKLEAAGTRLITEVQTQQSVSCVRGELQQVVTNIVNNAVEAMGHGGTLTLRVRDGKRWDSTGARGVRITIRDTGPGMSAEVLRRMREPFFTTKADSGTGLGMWVTYELVERHGGTVLARTCTSADRHGTVFSLFLLSAKETGSGSPEHQATMHA